MELLTDSSFMQLLDERFRAASGLRERRDYSIFYSSIQPSLLMILGWNPGGNPETWDESQLASKTFYENGEHEYVDCHYRLAVAMRSFLVTVLDLSSPEAIRSIPKSNLIFRRSTGQGTLPLNERAALEECRPFVQELISRVSPSHIILEGMTTLDAFAATYCSEISTDVDGATVVTPNGAHQARIYRADSVLVECLGKRVTLIGIGHPSKFAGRRQWAEVIQRARALLLECRAPSDSPM
jgi:hypothetical protein